MRNGSIPNYEWVFVKLFQLVQRFHCFLLLIEFKAVHLQGIAVTVPYRSYCSGSKAGFPSNATHATQWTQL